MKKTPKDKTPRLISVKEAAEKLEISEQQVRSLIRDSKLPAVRVGKSWIINEDDLEQAKDRPGPGRPKQISDDDDE